MIFAALGLAAAAAQPAPCWDAGAQARFQGDPARAEVILQSCMAADPDNADTLVQLGLARLALGDLDGAQSVLNRALEIAPDYDDARIALARIAYFRGDAAGALDRLSDVEPGRADAEALREQARMARDAEGAGLWRIDLSVSRSALTKNLPDWSLASAALGRRLGDRDAITGRLAWAERFNRDDLYGELRYDRVFGAGSSAYVAIGGSPDAVFSPEFVVRAGGERGLSGGFAATLNASAARYVSGEVFGLTPGLQKSFDGGARLVGVRAIGLRDEAGEIRTGWSGYAEADAGARTRMLASYTDAPETSEGVTLDVQTAALGIRHSIDARTGVRMDITHETRSAYERTALGVSVNRRF